MNMKKKLVIAAAALPMMFATAGAYAFGGKGGCGMDGPKGHFDRDVLRQLDLTEEQKDKLRDLRDAKRDEMQAKRDEFKDTRIAEMKAHHQAVQALVLADDFDEAKAQELAKAMIEKQSDRRVEKMKTKHEMLSILTEEQKAKLKDLQAERMEKMSGKMAKRMGKHHY